jgi:hypothetical protein
MCVCMAVVVVVMQEACFLAWFHEEMATFVVDEPVDHVLFAFGAAAAGAGEGVGGELTARAKRLGGSEKSVTMPRWAMK